MKFAADTGALLSLSCSSHLPIILGHNSLASTKAVSDELKQFATYSDFLGKHAQQVLKEIQRKTIIIEEPKVLLSLKISTAELSVFSLGKEKKYCILTDDLHAARVALQQLALPSKPCFYALLLLYKDKKMTKQQLLLTLDALISQRNWMNGALYSYAKKIIEEIKG